MIRITLEPGKVGRRGLDTDYESAIFGGVPRTIVTNVEPRVH
jgi:hypothetical protein